MSDAMHVLRGLPPVDPLTAARGGTKFFAEIHQALTGSRISYSYVVEL